MVNIETKQARALDPSERIEIAAQFGNGRFGTSIDSFHLEGFKPADTLELSICKPHNLIHTKSTGFELSLNIDQVFNQQLIILGYDSDGNLVEHKGAGLDVDRLGEFEVPVGIGGATSLGDRILRELKTGRYKA